MSGIGSPSASRDASYWHQRVREEAEAALACEDARIAAIHVELATHCLRMARQQAPSAQSERSFDFVAETP